MQGVVDLDIDIPTPPSPTPPDVVCLKVTEPPLLDKGMTSGSGTSWLSR